MGGSQLQVPDDAGAAQAAESGLTYLAAWIQRHIAILRALDCRAAVYGVYARSAFEAALSGTRSRDLTDEQADYAPKMDSNHEYEPETIARSPNDDGIADFLTRDGGHDAEENYAISQRLWARRRAFYAQKTEIWRIGLEALVNEQKRLENRRLQILRSTSESHHAYSPSYPQQAAPRVSHRPSTPTASRKARSTVGEVCHLYSHHNASAASAVSGSAASRTKRQGDDHGSALKRRRTSNTGDSVLSVSSEASSALKGHSSLTNPRQPHGISHKKVTPVKLPPHVTSQGPPSPPSLASTSASTPASTPVSGGTALPSHLLPGASSFSPWSSPEVSPNAAGPKYPREPPPPLLETGRSAASSAAVVDWDGKCPVCGEGESASEGMVACDSCNNWFHFRCVGYQPSPPLPPLPAVMFDDPPLSVNSRAATPVASSILLLGAEDGGGGSAGPASAQGGPCKKKSKKKASPARLPTVTDDSDNWYCRDCLKSRRASRAIC